MYKIALIAIVTIFTLTSCWEIQKNTWQNKNTVNNNQDQWVTWDVDWYLEEGAKWEFLNNSSHAVSEWISSDDSSISGNNPFNF